MPGTQPFLADAAHVHRQDVVRHVARMRQGHHGRCHILGAVGQQILETQRAVAPRQRRAARPDDQPVDASGQAEEIDRLHQRQPDDGVGARQHGQPRDLCAAARGDGAGQGDAAFDDQPAAARAGLDAGRADGLAAGLVEAQQNDRADVAVHGLDLGELRHRAPSQVVTVGLGPDRTGLDALRFGAGHADLEQRHVRLGGIG